MNINVIAFPNLGLSFTINRVAFTIFGRSVYWYALILTTGMILAVAYACWRGKKSEGIKTDDIIDYGMVSILAAIVGARLYYVLTTLNTGEYKTFLDYFAIWKGGLGFYGGLIGGLIAGIVLSKVKKINFLKVFDLASPAFLVGQLIGRWGNFVNGEAFGACDFYDFFTIKIPLSGCKNLPWLMNVNGQNCQPTFLYESLWNLVGFVLLNIFYKKKKFHGQMVCAYLAWYGLGRMFFEGMRTDSLYVGPIRISQLVGLIGFVGGTFLVFVGPKFFKPIADDALSTDSDSDTKNEKSENKRDDNDSESLDVVEESTNLEVEEKDGEDN